MFRLTAFFLVFFPALGIFGAAQNGATAEPLPPPYHLAQRLYCAPRPDQRLGHALAAGDDLLAAGAPWRGDDGLTRDGVVYLFWRLGPDGGPFQGCEILSPPGWLRGGEFGRALALDGDTLAVSARLDGPAYTDPLYDTGAVFIYVNDNGRQPQAVIVPPQRPEYAGFGTQIDLDGDALIVMADRAAYLYERRGEAWAQAARLDAPRIQSVAVAGDVALVGDLDDSDYPPRNNQGHVDVYARRDGVWSPAGTLSPDDGERDDYFGCALDFDGATAAVLACAEREAKPGRVYLFEFDGDSWTQAARLVPVGGDGPAATARRVAYDGQRIVTAAGPWVALFERRGGGWEQTNTLRPDGAASGGGFPWDVALSGGDVLASAPTQPLLNMAAGGAVYVFGPRPAGGGVVYAPLAARGELDRTAGLIVFQAPGNGGATDLFLAGRDGRGRTRLTDTPVNEFDAAWSPDGTRLIFVRDGGGGRRLVIKELDGGRETVLPTPGVSVQSHPNWSRDGARIVFENRRGPYGEIYVVGADGTGLTNLTGTLHRSEYAPVWSPDGTRIAYVNEGELSVMNADGSDAGPLGIGNQPAGRPAWSPDGQFILYDAPAERDLRQDIRVVTAETGAQADEIRHARNGRWSPDGTRVVFAGESGGIFHMDLDTYHLTVVQDSPFGDMPDWQP